MDMPGEKDYAVTHVHAWEKPSEIPSGGSWNLYVMKGVLAIGCLLGLTPGKLFEDSVGTHFSYVTWGTAYSALTVTLTICGKIFIGGE